MKGASMKACHQDFFERSGLKNTRQRDAVWHALEREKTPLTAEDIFVQVEKKDRDISLSTIYRILEMFERKKLVQKVKFEDQSKTFFEKVGEQHQHHLVCLKCHAITLLKDCPIDRYEKSVAKEHRFTITSHAINLYGYCHRCKA